MISTYSRTFRSAARPSNSRGCSWTYRAALRVERSYTITWRAWFQSIAIRPSRTIVSASSRPSVTVAMMRVRPSSKSASKRPEPPSVPTMKLAQAAETPAQWAAFKRHYLKEMAEPDAAHALQLLAALSQSTDFSVGCYCEDEDHCHRSVLRELLRENGGRLA